MSRSGMGYLALAVGAFMALGIAMNLGEGFGALAYALALLFCAALPIGVGVSLLRRGGAQALAARADQAWESELMRLAGRRGGSLTVAEVVAQADLSWAEAEQRLDRCCANGIAEHRVAEDGVMVYRFEGLLSEEEKRRAKGVLDA